MAVTRIKNNQITDSTIVANTKIVNYSVTSTLLANNLTYGSDLTIAGNLTVQGNTTTIDTTIVTVEDPMISLAYNQTGSPTLDIGWIGVRGTANNVAFIWDESAQEFLTGYTTDDVGNTTISIIGYANLHMLNANVGGNLTIGGNIDITGNVTSLNVTGNITGGNLLTPGIVSAAANVIGGNITTGGEVSSTGNVTGGNINTAGLASVGGNVIGANLTTGGVVTATGNIDGGNINTAGQAVATGNITGGNLLTGGLISATSTITSSANITGGNILTAGLISATGNINSGANIVATANVIGGNISTAGLVTATGNVTGGNLITAGLATVTGNITGGNLLTGGTITATGNITAPYFIGNIQGNIDAGGANTQVQFNDNDILAGSAGFTFDKTANLVTVTGNIQGGNLRTAGLASVTGNINSDANIVATANVIGGNISTAGLVTATGNITGGNLITGGIATVTGNINGGGNLNISGNVIGANVRTAGEVSAAGNVTANNVNTDNIYSSGSLTITADSGDLVLDPTGGNIDMSGAHVHNVGTPQDATDAATKQYVDDAVSSGITIHTPVFLEANTAVGGTYAQGGTTATVTNTVAGNTVVFSSAIDPQVNDQYWFTSSFSGIVANTPYFVVSAPNTSAAVLSSTYDGFPVTTITSATGLTQPVRINSGIGATLTNNGANATLVIDGVTTTANIRVLIYSEANAVHNGVYVVNQPGNATTAWQLTRSTDADVYGPKSIDELDAGDYFFVQSGDSGAGEAYVMTSPASAFIIGYNNIVFTQFSSSQVYTANTSAGLDLTGTVFSAKVDNNTTAFDGGGNIIVKASANLTTPNIGAATGTSLSVTANVTGGNILTGGLISSTGNVTGGNINTAGLITVTGNITGGNINTAGEVDAASVTATGNVVGGNVSTAGLITATGNVTGGNVLTGGLISSTGNITGGNVLTGGLISSTGNISGGNLYSAGTITSIGNVVAPNFIGNISGNIDAAGNINEVQYNGAGDLLTASSGFTFNPTGNVLTANGNINGANINASANILATGAANVTFNDNTWFYSGYTTMNTGGIFHDTGANPDTIQVSTNSRANGIAMYTDGVANSHIISTGGIDFITAGTLNANTTPSGGVSRVQITTDGLTANGIVSASGNVTGGNLITAGLATVTGNVTGGNLITAGLVNAAGNITGANVIGNTSGQFGNIIISTSQVDSTAGRITINGNDADVDFAVNSDTVANVFYVDAGTGTASFGTSTQTTNAIVAFNATTSILFPVGNTGQRPGTGATGMVRFNTTNNNLEVFDNSQWTAVGVPSFTVIADEQFNGDGSTVAFTLDTTQTTNSCIVSINGVVQIPTVAYSVAGTDPTCVLTFTEAPLAGDVIDVREITTTTTVTSISNGSGNAVVEVLDNSDTVQITGNLVPVTANAKNLGSSDKPWQSLYVAGNTIYLGTLQLKQTDAATFTVFQADGTTQANIDVGNVDVSALNSGNSIIGISGTNGNAYMTIRGVANVLVASNTGVAVTGTLSASGNITGSNFNSSVVTSTTLSATGNVIGGNILTSGLISATGAITGAGITGTSLTVSTGNITGGNLLLSGAILDSAQLDIQTTASNANIAFAPNGTGLVTVSTQVSAVGNITGGNLRTAGQISATGNISGANISGTNLTVSTGNITGGNLILSGAILDSGQLDIQTTGLNGNIALAPNGTGMVTVSSQISVVGNVQGGNIRTAGLISATGAITGAAITGSSLTVTTGNVTAGNIVNGNGNGVGNIGSSTTYFNTVFAKATSAQYADLAEKYVADAEYAPGTVVVFGGTHEVTVNAIDADRKVAGVVSTNPSYIMNGGLEAEHVATVALTGRVPTMVVGTVRKGDLMVAAGLGRARAEADPKVGTVIGKALEDFDGAEGTIEVVVGRF